MVTAIYIPPVDKLWITPSFENLVRHQWGRSCDRFNLGLVGRGGGDGMVVA